MNADIHSMLVRDIVPVVRATLCETAELRGAVQVLSERLGRLTDELGHGELVELARAVAHALRASAPAQNGAAR
jgi:hypothetical protein